MTFKFTFWVVASVAIVAHGSMGRDTASFPGMQSASPESVQVTPSTAQQQVGGDVPFGMGQAFPAMGAANPSGQIGNVKPSTSFNAAPSGQGTGANPQGNDWLSQLGFGGAEGGLGGMIQNIIDEANKAKEQEATAKAPTSGESPKGGQAAVAQPELVAGTPRASPSTPSPTIAPSPTWSGQRPKESSEKAVDARGDVKSAKSVPGSSTSTRPSSDTSTSETLPSISGGNKLPAAFGAVIAILGVILAA